MSRPQVEYAKAKKALTAANKEYIMKAGTPLTKKPKHDHRNSRGATLIEVLVAIFLLTVGLLAMAALTVNASNYNKMTQIRGVGTMLVNDYAERARANIFGFDRGGYAKTSSINGTLATPTLPSVNNTEATAADKMAEYDQAEWLKEVARRLPKGSAYVTVEVPTNAGDRGLRAMNVWITWQEQDSQISLMNTSPVACPAGASAPTGTRCMFFRVAI